MDVLVDLGQELRGGDIGLFQDVLNLLVELLDLRRCTHLDGVILVDLLDRLDLLVRLFGAFEQLGKRQLVRHHVLVQVDVVDHIELQELADDLIALIVWNHDL